MRILEKLDKAMNSKIKILFLTLALLILRVESGVSSRLRTFYLSDEDDFSSLETPITNALYENDAYGDIESMEMDLGTGHDNPNPDIHLTTPELIEKYGFPAEIHQVTTEDGYILTMHRIPGGKKDSIINAKDESSRPIVFLQHGMFGTSADWILNAENKCLGYMLAETGYDVWLGNARGNKYSTAHTTLSTKRIKYWRFSWDEMGRFDLPAALDYVLNTTGRNNLSYIGHSMGTTMFFVLLSAKPEYNSKVNFMGALGPAVYINHATSPARYLAKFYGRIERIILDFIGHGVFLPRFVTKALQLIGPKFCTETMKIDKLCEQVMFLLAGHDPAQTNYTELPVILAHAPSTVSTHTGFHYFQHIKSGEFRRYDYGTDNMKIYGTSSPPEYNLSNVQVPIGIFWAPNDALCTPVDVARLSRILPNVTLNHRVNFTEFNHIDFIFAKDVDVLVNKPLLAVLASYV